MEQEQLTIFIQSIVDYFNKITRTAIDVGVPFLKPDEQSVLLTYTGAIGISGRMKGAIYITAEETFIAKLLQTIMPDMEIQPRRLESMVGELANTIAGNAQKAFGTDFLISIPIILTSKEAKDSSRLELKAPTFVVPLRWMENNAFLAVAIEN